MIGIIFNPASNSGNSAERMKALLGLLDAKGAEYVYRETRSRRKQEGTFSFRMRRSVSIH